MASCDVGSQTDFVAASANKKYVAVTIENERDEDLNGGVIPQLPASNLVLIPLKKEKPVCSKMTVVNLTGLADIAPSDPETEFIDFNGKNEIVITLQENNNITVVNAKTGKVISHFSAGTVNLVNADTKRESALTFNKTQKDRRLEPDAVQWLDNDRFITTNEGNHKGGSRGFIIFRNL